MQKNSLEKIMLNILKNDEYLKSEKRCYRLIVSRLTNGLIAICGERKVGKRLFAINLVDNLVFYNDVDALYVSNKQSKEELAIRVATCRGGVNPIYNSAIAGANDYIKNHLTIAKNIKIIDKAEASDSVIKGFVHQSTNKHKIIIFDDIDLKELITIRNYIEELNAIVIATISNTSSDDYKSYKNISDFANVIVRLEPRASDGINDYMKVNIIRNKDKELDRIDLKVNQFRQKLYETYERDIYDID